MFNYKKGQIELNDILLDVENPRFASYFERSGNTNPTQEDAMKYLLNYASIDTLAVSIKNSGGLYPTEQIACVIENGKYIVLEGNRRVCACKTLLKISAEKDIAFLPDDVGNSFSVINNIEDEDLINSLKILDAVIYDSRELAQPYIVDKHIDGVRKWESIEKSCYYYTRFTKTDISKKADERILDITKLNQSDKKGEIRNCIIKYGFFIECYKAMNNTPDASSEKISFLPLVDKFMPTLVGKEYLDLSTNDSLKYIIKNSAEQIYIEILKIVGEAFLVRLQEPNADSSKRAADNQFRIHTDEVKNKSSQEKLINDDVRIKGLKDLIAKYRTADKLPIASQTVVSDLLSDNLPDFQIDSQVQNNIDNNTPKNIIEEEINNIPSQAKVSESIYEPQLPWTPKPIDKKILFFSETEGKSFNLQNNNDTDVKILFILSELSKLQIDKFPYSCTSLYRLLLEAVTKKAYCEKKPVENKKVLTFDKNYLPKSITILARNLKGLKTKPTECANIINYVDKLHFIGTLNNYMHNPKLVDVQLLLNSWKTMKDYIKACLE
jgi:hypothetical protein